MTNILAKTFMRSTHNVGFEGEEEQPSIKMVCIIMQAI